MTSKPAIWKDRIAECEHSGLSQRVYCKKHGIRLSTFYYWKKRLLKADNNQFVKLSTDEYKAEIWKLIIPGEVRIIFQKAARLETIMAVLEALCLSTGKR
jgi:transposase